MKRVAPLVVLVALTMVLVTGCGISKDDYDATVKVADALRAELSSVKADLTAAHVDLSKSKADLATLQQNLITITADRDSVKSQLDKATAVHITDQADLATAQQALSTLNASIKAAQPYVDVATAWLEFWDASNQAAAISKLDSAVSATQDSALKTAWDTLRTTTGDMHITAEWTFINRLLEQLTVTVPQTN
jgi:chromosome segregation ATPase